MIRSRCLAAVSVLFFAGFACAQTMQVTVPHFSKNPTIDGHVSSDEQSGAAKLSMTLVGGLEKPKYATTVYLFTNEGGLYLGFVCDEPAMNTIVHKAGKDNGPVFDDDSVQLFLSPNREATKTNYFHFAVNTDGNKYSNSMQDDRPVEAWQAGASKGDKAWQAEIFVPFSVLGGETESPYWRMNVARERPERSGEKEETTAWINPGASLHNYKRFGFVQFKQPGTAPTAGASASSPSALMTTTASPAVSPTIMKGGPAPTIAVPAAKPLQTPAK